jgi:hypothetical protein
MKQYSFLLALLFTSSIGFGQSLQDINEMMGKLQHKKAKDGIDKFLSDPKNAAKAEGWFYKGRIYNNYSKDSTVSIAESYTLKKESFEAFKKYQQLDSKEVSFILEQHGSYFDLYNGFFDIGAREFGNKNFSTAVDGFKAALMVEDYVRTKGYEYNGYKFPALDTSVVLNTALAASNAKDEVTAISYYKKLTDASVSGEQYKNIYEYLAEYYAKQKDDASFKAIIEKGRSLYPNEKIWDEMEIDAVSNTGNKEALIAKYEELMAKQPTEYLWPYNLGVELYNSLYAGDKKPANIEATKAKLSEALIKAIKNDKAIDASVLMMRHKYNDAYEYQDSARKIKGMKPDDVKKRNEIKAAFLKKVDEAISYTTPVINYYAALSTLKPIQKINYKSALDYMNQFYTAKNDLKKAAEYEKKRLEVDKM